MLASETALAFVAIEDCARILFLVVTVVPVVVAAIASDLATNFVTISMSSVNARLSLTLLIHV